MLLLLNVSVRKFSIVLEHRLQRDCFSMMVFVSKSIPNCQAHRSLTPITLLTDWYQTVSNFLISSRFQHIKIFYFLVVWPIPHCNKLRNYLGQYMRYYKFPCPLSKTENWLTPHLTFNTQPLHLWQGILALIV